jgi:hypothetical protein
VNKIVGTHRGAEAVKRITGLITAEAEVQVVESSLPRFIQKIRF